MGSNGGMLGADCCGRGVGSFATWVEGGQNGSGCIRGTGWRIVWGRVGLRLGERDFPGGRCCLVPETFIHSLIYIQVTHLSLVSIVNTWGRRSNLYCC